MIFSLNLKNINNYVILNEKIQSTISSLNDENLNNCEFIKMSIKKETSTFFASIECKTNKNVKIKQDNRDEDCEQCYILCINETRKQIKKFHKKLINTGKSTARLYKEETSQQLSSKNEEIIDLQTYITKEIKKNYTSIYE